MDNWLAVSYFEVFPDSTCSSLNKASDLPSIAKKSLVWSKTKWTWNEIMVQCKWVMRSQSVSSQSERDRERDID